MPSVNGAVTQAKTTDPEDVNSWRDWLGVSGNIDGTWRTAQNVYVKHNNTWKQVWIRLGTPTNVFTSPRIGEPAPISRVYWTSAVGADLYYIYLSTNPSVPYAIVPEGTSYVDVQLPQYYTTYTVAVRAYSNSSFSAAASATAYVPIADASVVSITSTAGTRDQTLTFNRVYGADYYEVYRRTSPTGSPTLAKTVTVSGVGSTTTTVTVPDFYTTYYYSVKAFNTDNGTNSSNESSQVSTTVSLTSVNVTSIGYDDGWDYTAVDEWDGVYPRLFIDWDAHANSGAGTIEYVIEQRNNSTGVWSEIDTVAQGTTIWRLRSTTTNTQLSYRVKVRHISTGNVGPATARYNFNNGKYRTRVNSTSTYTGWAQSSWPGTTNGQFTANFNGTAFNIWAYQVKFEIETSFSSRITLYPNRKIRLIRPGTTVDLPDNEPSPSAYTYSVSTQNAAFTVDPYGTSWSSNSAGTKGTVYADCTITVYTRVISTQEVAPTAS